MPHWDSKPLEKQLQNYKQQIEQEEAELTKHLTEVVEGIYQLHSKQNNKSIFGSPFIESIKEIRMITGWGLLESKAFVETLHSDPFPKTITSTIAADTMSLKKSTKWVSQYRVQSSDGKKEYVVSQCEDGHYECSCPNWTRHTPREDCKHILRKKLELLQAPQITVGLSITQATGRKFR